MYHDYFSGVATFGLLKIFLTSSDHHQVSPNYHGKLFKVSQS